MMLASSTDVEVGEHLKWIYKWCESAIFSNKWNDETTGFAICKYRIKNECFLPVTRSGPTVVKATKMDYIFILRK